MGQEHEGKASDVNASRRRVLASFAGAVTTGLNGWFRGEYHQDISPSTNSNRPMKQGEYSTPTQYPRGQRLAYVALPGLSIASLLANLPYLMYGSSKLRPVIIMDIHDYNRLQAVALKETDSPWNQSLAMACGHLFQRGVIRLIDYSEFYINNIQQKIIGQNRAVLEKVPDDDQKRAAKRAAQGRIEYQRGEYQESFRADLSEDLDTFIGGRRTEKARRQKLKRGLGSPLDWNERIFNQYAAALEIRRWADDVFDHLNVEYVIGEGESAIIRGDELSVDTSYIADGNPDSNIQYLPPEYLKPTREAFDAIGQIARDITGVQHDDWVLLAPNLAIPQYDDLFDISTMETQIEDGLNPENLADEVIDVVTLLDKRTEERSDTDYVAEWFVENETMPFADNPAQKQGITEILDYRTTLAQFSDELRDWVWDDKVTHVAGLIGASIVSDPSPHDDLDVVYQQGEDLINRLNPRSVNDPQLVPIRRRMQGWGESSDWYEKIDRSR
jgi:hypothetical protein